MKTFHKELTLFNRVKYEIRVSGHLEKHYFEGSQVESIGYENGEGEHPETILTCFVDQAALLGIIRRLYNYGLPLISVHFHES